VATYRVPFEGFLRNGASGRKLSVKGQRVPLAELPPQKGRQWTILLAVPGGTLLARPGAIQKLGATGKPLWTRKMGPNPVLAVRDDRVYFENEELRLGCATLGNDEVMRNLYLTGSLGKESEIRLFAPREADFLLGVYIFPVGHYDPKLSLTCSEYGANTCKWGEEWAGQPVLPPLYFEKLERVLFASEPNGVQLFDAAKGGQILQLPLSATSPVGWSGAEDGTTFLLGARAGRQSLVATDLLGVDRWQWALGPGESFCATQPPILGPEGQVYALSQARVSCVKLGLHLWSFACPAPSYGCSLADNSILIATGKLLVQLDALGQKKLEVDLEAPAVAPPVVDETGKVFVATRTHLVRID
jgi:hypothetical protein